VLTVYVAHGIKIRMKTVLKKPIFGWVSARRFLEATGKILVDAERTILAVSF
jgi:hypothetical protein